MCSENTHGRTRWFETILNCKNGYRHNNVQRTHAYKTIP
jgi:hypothetical protein